MNFHDRSGNFGNILDTSAQFATVNASEVNLGDGLANLGHNSQLEIEDEGMTERLKDLADRELLLPNFAQPIADVK